MQGTVRYDEGVVTLVTNTRGSNISVLDRIRGTVMLQRETYDEIARDKGALPQAMAIVVAASLANGFANTAEGGPGFIGGFLQMAVGFVVMSTTVWLLGRLLESESDDIPLTRVMSTVGYAALPVILYAFTPLPAIGMLLNFIGSVWSLCTAVLAVSAALSMSIGKAFVTLIGGAFVAGLGILFLVVPFFN